MGKAGRGRLGVEETVIAPTIDAPPMKGGCVASPRADKRGTVADFQKSLGGLISDARMVTIRAGGADRTVALGMLTKLRAIVDQALDVLDDLRLVTAANRGPRPLNELGGLCFLVSVEIKASRGHLDHLSTEIGHLAVISILEQTEAKLVRGLCAVSDLARAIDLSKTTRHIDRCRSTLDSGSFPRSLRRHVSASPLLA